MSLYGYTTKRDLTTIGNLLVMALIGFLLASLVNIFLQSPAIYWITTYAGIIIFVGLTAWDTQRIKAMTALATDEQQARRIAIFGAPPETVAMLTQHAANCARLSGDSAAADAHMDAAERVLAGRPVSYEMAWVAAARILQAVVQVEPDRVARAATPCA